MSLLVVVEVPEWSTRYSLRRVSHFEDDLELEVTFALLHLIIDSVVVIVRLPVVRPRIVHFASPPQERRVVLLLHGAIMLNVAIVLQKGAHAHRLLSILQ